MNFTSRQATWFCRAVGFLGLVALAGSVAGCAPSHRAPPSPAEPGAGRRGADSPEATAEQWGKVVEVWDAAQLAQVRITRQVVAESALDGPTKRKVGDLLARLEADLRGLVAEARRDPASAGAALRRARAVFDRAGEELKRQLTPARYEQTFAPVQAVSLQCTLLSSDPAEYRRNVYDGLAATAAQRERVGPVIDGYAEAVGRLKGERARAAEPGRLMDLTDQVFELTIDANARVRAALTPEQLRRFDTGFLPGPVDEPPDPAPGAPRAPDEAPGTRTSSTRVSPSPLGVASTAPATAPASRGFDAGQLYAHYRLLPGTVATRRPGPEEARAVLGRGDLASTPYFEPREWPTDSGTIRFLYEPGGGRYWAHRVNRMNPGDSEWLLGRFPLPDGR